MRPIRKQRTTAFECLFDVMTRPWVVVLFFIFMVVSYFFLDKAIAVAMHAVHVSKILPWLASLTKLGLGMFYMVFIAIIAFICRVIFRNKLWECRAWFLWLCVVVANLVCLVFKMMLGRARPEMFFSSSHLYGFYGPHTRAAYWSFPSGHTSTIMGLAFGLCALFPRYSIGFILVGLVVPCSRILLAQHYFSDVIFSSYLALIEVGLLYYWSQSWLLGRVNDKNQ